MKNKKEIGDLLQKIGFGVGFFGLCSANIPSLVIMASITAGCELVGKIFGGSAWDELFICRQLLGN